MKSVMVFCGVFSILTGLYYYQVRNIAHPLEQDWIWKSSVCWLYLGLMCLSLVLIP